MKIAVLDLGTNSFHLVVYRVKGMHVIEQVKRHAMLNTLGSCLDEHNELSYGDMQKAVAVIAALCAIAHAERVDNIYAYGTGVFRRMSNRTAFIDEIFKQTGLVVDVISEKKEIALNLAAIKRLHALSGRSLIVDIGGGSSEFLVAEGKKLVWSTSLPFGTTHVDLFIPYTKQTLHDASKQISSIYKKVVQKIAKNKIETIYATSGCMRCLALWKKNRRCDDTAYIQETGAITLNDVSRFQAAVRAGNTPKRSLGRQKIMWIGAQVSTLLMKRLALDMIIVSPASTREGYAIETLRYR